MDQGWAVFGAIVVAFAGTAIYVGHCAWRPYADCRKCDGRGNFKSRTGRSWRNCRRCKGSGARIRYGRRMWSVLTKVKKAAVG